MRTIEDEHWWFVARRQIIGTVLKSMKLPDGASILEVGCGTGGNLEMLSLFGNLIGVEQDAAALSIARGRGVAPVVRGNLPDELPAFSRGFDLVALFDVIEHVEQDGVSLRYLRQLLNPGGRIVITVPAFRFLWSQHDVENRHFRRYRRRDLNALAEGCALSLDYASYFNFWLFLPAAAVRVIRKVVPYRQTWQDMRLPSRWLNASLRSVFGSERHLLGRMSLPFGLSLLAVLSAPGAPQSAPDIRTTS